MKTILYVNNILSVKFDYNKDEEYIGTSDEERFKLDIIRSTKYNHKFMINNPPIINQSFNNNLFILQQVENFKKNISKSKKLDNNSNNIPMIPLINNNSNKFKPNLLYPIISNRSESMKVDQLDIKDEIRRAN